MIVCIGGAVLDRKYRARAPIVAATSNPADGFRSFGGVGRNICENLARLGRKPKFVSLVGDDENGRAIVDHLRQAGADVEGVGFSAARPTAEYVAILEPGNDLALGIADMSVFEDIKPDRIAPALVGLTASDRVLFDCNLPQTTIEWLVAQRQRIGFQIAADSVSTIKATRLIAALSGLDLLFTNRDEASAILGVSARDEALAGELHARGVSTVILTRGAEGLLVSDDTGTHTVAAFPADPVDVTGAGDALVAGTLSALLQGKPILDAAEDGALLAAATIESASSVLPNLSADFLSAARARMPKGKTRTD